MLGLEIVGIYSTVSLITTLGTFAYLSYTQTPSGGIGSGFAPFLNLGGASAMGIMWPVSIPAVTYVTITDMLKKRKE
jgi:hypothetical protein